MKDDQTAQRFEDQLAKLERIVTRLEDDSVGLEEALDLFEEGMQLARACRSRLEAVEKRIEKLLVEAEQDAPVTEPFDPDVEAGT